MLQTRWTWRTCWRLSPPRRCPTSWTRWPRTLTTSTCPPAPGAWRHVCPGHVSRVACCRTAYRCEKEPTGELNRDTLINHINEIALNTPDAEEKVKFEAGVKRGKVYVPKYSEEESAEMEKTESGQVIQSNIFICQCKYFSHFRCGWIPRRRRRCPTPP